MRTALVALGGNALLRPGRVPTLAAQRRRVRLAASTVRRLAHGRRLVVTHGNGPQVGAILRRSELAAREAYAIDLATAVAQSEGELGFLLQRAIANSLATPVVALLTQALVSRRDPAFRRPTKPIGPSLPDAAIRRARRAGIPLVETPHGWRRAVPSPRPERILEAPAISHLLRAGFVVIAAGGGGIPVAPARSGRGFAGVEAVVDKDLASACLAREIGATEMLLLTDVDGVYEGFGTRRARRLRRLRSRDARKLLATGELPPGSMGPKVEAALEFLSHVPRGRVVIGALERPLEGTIVMR